ncbi:MAG: type II toxin-antitoxin system VapC family toxin [Pseudomonadota bacterium]
MIALDTSVLARFILNDTPAEQQLAEQLIAENKCSVSWSVLIELSWVLEYSVRLPRKEVVSGLVTVADTDGISVPDAGLLAWALDRYASGADFADMIHLVSATNDATEFACFDRKLARQAGPETPLAVRTLRS